MEEPTPDKLTTLKQRLDRLEGQFSRLETDMHEIRRELGSTDSKRPGIALRLDRMERLFYVVVWLVGGGALGIAALIAMLSRIGDQLTGGG